mgnify:CR=1 FL=1
MSDDEPRDVREFIAAEALRLVAGPRATDYGPVEENFERVARFWTAYLQNTGRNVVLGSSDVAPMMRMLKEARLCGNDDHLDSFIDLVGYTLLGAEVNGAEE